MKELSEDNSHLKSKYSRKVWMVIGTVAVVLAILYIAAVIMLVDTRPASSPPQILDVYVSPEHPTSSDDITVTAHVVSDSSAYLQVGINYCSFFSSSRSGGSTMLPIGNDLYEIEMTRYGIPFPDGTEVWFMVIASVGYGDAVISDSYTFQVGEVLRNGPSGLTIHQVTHTPQEPTTEDDIVVTATIFSDAEITDVELSYMHFLGAYSGSGSSTMIFESGDNYTGEIAPYEPFPPMPSDGGFSEGQVFYYRVAAMDETGNTALSDVYTFTIS